MRFDWQMLIQSDFFWDLTILFIKTTFLLSLIVGLCRDAMFTVTPKVIYPSTLLNFGINILLPKMTEALPQPIISFNLQTIL